MQTPVVGRTVQVTVNPRMNNGQSVAAGQITSAREVEEGEDGKFVVGVRVLLDTGETVQLRDIPLVDKKDADDAANEHAQGRVAYYLPRA